MSDALDQAVSAAPADASTSAPDASAAAPTTIDQSASTGAPETDVFASIDAEKIFGLPAETKPDADAQPDVTTAANLPASRQSEEVEKPAESTDSSPDTQGDSQSDDATTAIQKSEKLDWQSAPDQFREAHEDLKKWATDLVASHPETQFVSSPQEFAKWMKETSPTSYNQVGAMMVEESGKAYPDKWIDFLLNENPEITLEDGKKLSTLDYAAQAISGREGMTADRLKAELALVLEDDEEDVQAKLEAQKAERDNAKKPEAAETPEQKAIREWREEKAANEMREMQTEFFSPIETAVDALVSQAGLEIKDTDFKGKSWNDLDEDTRFKVFANQMIPFWIDFRIKMDPAHVSMQGRLEEFMNAKDKTSALKLQHPAKIAAENFANEVLGFITTARAKAKEDGTKPPAQEDPPPMVRTAGAAPALNGNGQGAPTDDDWNVTEADFYKKR